ncbi:MAG: RNA polymerase sigma factor [Methylobacter sp.]|nr:RNA polymerase sigma factor [Methylobacter sp.]
MVVIKFPLRSEHFQETETDSPAADGSYQFRDGAEFEGNLESESWHDTYGSGDHLSLRGKPPKNPGRKKGLSPTQIIAQSLGPSSPMHTVKKRTPTPAEIIAQSLQPQSLGGGAELLGDSFWQGWMEHEEYLRRKCLYLLGSNREDVEDVLSAAMIQAFQNFTNQSCGVGNMRAWLTTIVHNACMDGFRKSKRKNNFFTDIETSEMENIPAEYGAPSQSPEDIVRIRESLDELYQLILALPETLREPLLLRTIEHLSYPEIAMRLNLTEANVRKRLQQARDRLRASKLSDGLSEYSGNTPRNY